MTKKQFEFYPLFALFLSLAMMATGIVFCDNYYTWAFLGGYLLLVLAFGYWKPVLKGLIGLAVFELVFAGITYLITKDMNQTSKASLRAGAACIGFIPLLGLSYTNLGKNLDTLHALRFLSLVILIFFSFIPILNREAKTIKLAMKARGGRTYGVVSFFHRLIVPFLVRVSSMSDMLALSVELRGFQINKRVKQVYSPVVPHWQDLVYLVGTLCLVGGMIGVGIWMR